MKFLKLNDVGSRGWFIVVVKVPAGGDDKIVL